MEMKHFLNILVHNIEMQHATSTDELDWNILSPGLLHFEVHARRAFIKFNWSVLKKSIAKELGFTYKNSLGYIKERLSHRF